MLILYIVKTTTLVLFISGFLVVLYSITKKHVTLNMHMVSYQFIYTQYIINLFLYYFCLIYR